MRTTLTLDDDLLSKAQQIGDATPLFIADSHDDGQRGVGRSRGRRTRSL